MTKGPENLASQGGKVLRIIGEVIDQGEETLVSFPLDAASFAFRISKGRLKELGRRRQGLEIYVTDDRVKIALRGNEKEKRGAYLFLYSILNNLNRPAALEKFLSQNEVPAMLRERVEDIGSTLNVARWNTLPDGEEEILAIELHSLWSALKDRSGLFPPENVFSSTAVE